MAHRERHRVDRVGWLRAAVLGANDGVISTASLMVGVAAAGSPAGAVLTAGVAGLAAGAMSMAAGEYVSVRSQADTEGADIARERAELATQPESERAELEGIYRQRGLDADLARQVAAQLMARDALGAHVRDELGITEALQARPLQAALASAGSFAIGSLVPILAAILAPGSIGANVASTMLSLLGLGALAASAGGSSVAKGALRVAFWGAVAMAMTAAAGHFLGAVVDGG
jgi:VIT1/CCC1 family predicted Fe2+/Mn2+ transporter